MKSISFTNNKQRVSVMTQGEHSSNASSTEAMHIFSSTVRAKLANHDHWGNFTAGEHFKVSADS
ncbi:MAG TPA: pyrimidine/purine nucleoside phosphorylase [Gammaproteobacteria bacterium]|nr:pyrimidine/purine nucleoside phosphorylase [Gammaproteobacteria bacterium]